ncbi:MAG: hypothetical protein KC643_05615 [Nitrospira sp.]|nr:hypothetical protein [Nitrospira sp.]MCB9776699.1 hypothetical protein [Nitrospiraceae bacterium]
MKVYEALQYIQSKQKVSSSDGQWAKLRNKIVNAESQKSLPGLNMVDEMLGLYQSVRSSFPHQPSLLLQFIGSREHEGTTTIVRELGFAIGEKLHKSVLIVDGDRRTLGMHKVLGLSPKLPLWELVERGGGLEAGCTLIGKSNVSLALLNEARSDSLNVGEQTNGQEFWEKLRSQFEFVVVDSPPMSISTDGLSVCAASDGVILVVEAEKTRTQVIASLRDRIAQHGGKVQGVVFNRQRHYIPEWLYRRL